MNIARSAHDDRCPYAQWYDANARYQPLDALTVVARETMVEVTCNCDGPIAATPPGANPERTQT